MGSARLLERYALTTNSIGAANQAAALVPSDPEAHLARALLLNRSLLTNQAKDAQELAASLRPNDYSLWLALGMLRDDSGETEAALTALNDAVRFAPYYAQTHWQRGNLLLRLGRYDEAFADLRIAANSNRVFVPVLIDLAWSISRGNPKLTEQLIGPLDYKMRIQFARFLARNGKGREAMDQFRASEKSFSEAERRDLMRQLIETKAYQEAFAIWKGSVGFELDKGPVVFDGGFEGQLAYDEVGFGWRVARNQDKTVLSQDITEKQSGSKSLRIAFEGNSNPGTFLVSQTLLVKPQQHYKVNFAVMTKDLVTGGLPLVTAKDAATGQLLGKSVSFPPASNTWQTISFEFKTLPTSAAIILNVERSSCSSAPCPVFGVVWLDSFSLEEARATSHDANEN
jgi:tetratricopeptide (TPR) repeat protein